jgi:cell division protein ZapE
MFKSRLNLLKQYHAAVNAKEIHLNTHQEHILKILETCYHRPITFRLPWQKKYIAKKNVYIYGSVGSGKTFIMDLFFDAIPHQKKLRTHFHQFMEQIAEDLRRYQGLKNPMQKIVNQLIKNYQVICLDEMMVQDVVQAMLLLELIPTLMSQDVMLVFTSNIKPSDLYLNGLQRDRFMQVINYIEDYAHVCSLTSSIDYRMQRLPLPEQTYFFPSLKQHFQDLFVQFAKHLKEEIHWNEKLLIQKREIESVASTKDLVWFEFSKIAVIPRCQRDYLEIAKIYKTVFISDVPQFKSSETANVILWMYLVDVFYNAQVKLIISAKASLEQLYLEGPLEKEFKRTISRMKEMQTKWYWDLA